MGRDSMNIHDIANQLPPLSAEDLETLVEDIDQHGQLVPAIVDEQGLLLDGRHRLIACQRLGIELRTVVFTGSEEEKRALSRSHNDVRRHLSEIQRSLRANDAAQLKRGTNRYEEKVEATTVASTTITI
jgi:ParB-like chromosome segregation protein Spo0J